MKTPAKIGAFREEFPALKGKIYFNHAAFSVRPRCVTEASVDGLNLEATNCLDIRYKRRWNDLREETRRQAGELIVAKPRNVAFVSSTSYGLSIVSLALPWKRGDNVVTAAVENPANVAPWQNLKHLGVEVRYLPGDRDDLLDVGRLAEFVDRRTRLVSLGLVGYATGQRLDIGRVAEFCRPRGILVAVDAVQAVGAVPVDVKALGVNFLCAGAQKWLLGPRNIGIMYADDAAIERSRQPIVTEHSGEMSEVDPFTAIPRLRWNEGALKFEEVSYRNFPGVFGLRGALEVFRRLGKEFIYRRVRGLTDELVSGLQELDGRVVSPRGDGEWSGIVSFALNRASPVKVAEELRKRDVYVAVRLGRIRISPHFYNTSGEIERFLGLLGKAIADSR